MWAVHWQNYLEKNDNSPILTKIFSIEKIGENFLSFLMIFSWFLSVYGSHMDIQYGPYSWRKNLRKYFQKNTRVGVLKWAENAFTLPLVITLTYMNKIDTHISHKHTPHRHSLAIHPHHGTVWNNSINHM